MKNDEAPIVVEQDFPCSAEKLWNALTDVDLMRQWFFDNIPDFRPEVGFKTDFPVVSGERTFHHNWEVTTAEPLRVIEYRWWYPEYDGLACVRFEIHGNDQHSQLKFSAIAVKSFPQDIEEFKRESAVAGWDYFLREQLVDFLS